MKKVIYIISSVMIIFAVTMNACYAQAPLSLENKINVSKKIEIKDSDTLEEANAKAREILKNYHVDEADIPTMSWDTQYNIPVNGKVKVEISNWKDSGTCMVKVFYDNEEVGMIDTMKADEGKPFNIGTQPDAYAVNLGNYLRTNYGIDLEDSKISQYMEKDIIGNTERYNKTFTWEFDYQINIPVILSKNLDKVEGGDATATHQYAGSKTRPDWYMAKLQSGGGETLEDPLDNPDAYAPGEVTGNTKVFQIAGTIISIVKIVGIALSVIMLMLLGIKFLTGSVEEKAEYKKTMIPYLVGILLLFAGSFLVQIIYDFAVGL